MLRNAGRLSDSKGMFAYKQTLGVSFIKDPFHKNKQS